MKIILISFFSVLVVGFVILYSENALPSFYRIFHPAVSVPPETSPYRMNNTYPSTAPSSGHSIYPPTYTPSLGGRTSPADAMPTPSNFKGPAAGGTPQIHGPSGPPPNY